MYAKCSKIKFDPTDYSLINLEDADHVKTWCESTCAGSQWDQGYDDFTSPCNADLWVSSFESDDEDHHDDHHEESSAWEFIFPDEVFIDSIQGSMDQRRLAPNRTRTSKI